MSEFYELKQSKVTPKKYGEKYWEQRCKESEAQVEELNAALIASIETVNMLEATIHTIDKFLKKIGVVGKDGKSILDAILTTGVSVSLTKGKKPSVSMLKDETYPHPVDQLKKLDGVDISATPLSGINIWPHYRDEDTVASL